MRAHWCSSPLIVNEKNMRTRAIKKLLMLDSELDPLEMRTQSYRGPGISPRFQEGVAQIVSWYMPVVADGFDGAQKMARAEWYTLM